MGLIRRFDDPATEAAYVRAERLSRVPTLRIACLFGIGFHALALLAHLLLSAGVFALAIPVPRDVLVVGAACQVVAIALMGLAFVLYSKGYLAERRSAEAGLMSLYALAVAALFVTMALSYPEGVRRESMTPLVQWAFLLMAWSVLIVASVRWFLVITAGLVAIFALYLMVLPDPLSFELFMTVFLLLFVWLAIFVNWNLDKRARELFAANRAVEDERAKAEELLYNVLPQEVAARLRSGEAVADSFSDVSVIFADIVGFSKLAKTLSPGHLVNLLNRYFSIADQCAERLGIEKVKTIGDAYLAVANGTASGERGACEAVAFARELVAAMRDLAGETGIDINLRVGIHTGPVVGGVVGERRLAYDYWGDTMNVASRIESAARPNGIAVSAATFFQCARLYEFGEPETMTLKGVGETQIYHLTA